MTGVDDLTRKRIEQLRLYAEWEKRHYPQARQHILDWAADELERLFAKRSAEPEAEVRGIVTRKGRYTCVPGSEASRARPGGRTHGL